MTNEIRNAIQVAQSAVDGIPDAGLRAAAFPVVLAHVLGSTSSGSPVEVAPRRGSRQRKTTHAAEPKGRSNAARRGPATYISALIDDGFFKTPHTVGDITEKLAERGHHVAGKHVATYLQRFCQNRQLRRTKQADGEGRRAVYRYAEW